MANVVEENLANDLLCRNNDRSSLINKS